MRIAKKIAIAFWKTYSLKLSSDLRTKKNHIGTADICGKVGIKIERSEKEI